MLISERKKVTIRFLTPILGSAPANRTFYEAYLLKKLKDEIEKIEKRIEKGKGDVDALIEQKKYLEEQLKNLPEIVDTEDVRLTVFYRGNFNGYEVPVIRSHQVFGFLKEAGNNFKSVFKIKALRDKIAKYVRVYPFDLYIYDEKIGEDYVVDAIDDVLERPISAMTMKGKRIAVVKSEMIKSSGEKLAEFEVVILKNDDVNWDLLEKLFEYGKYNGIGQWRTAGYGAFEVVEVKNA